MNAETQAALAAYWRRIHAIPNPRKEHRSIVALQREHFRPPTEVETSQQAPRQLARKVRRSCYQSRIATKRNPRGNMTNAEDYRQLASQEATLAKAAVTHENRAQHYAMAAYYTRLADAKEKLARTAEGMTSNDVYPVPLRK